MRIVLMGAVEFSRRTLEELIAMGQEVVGVCTLASSKFNADHVDLCPVATAHGIACRYTPDANDADTLRWIADLRPDVVFCFGWSRLLRGELLAIAPLGVVGFHPAALPRNRGRHPIVWALALGLTETASTFFFMDEGADSGDILSQARVPISAGDDAGALYAKIVDQALSQIREFVPQLASRSYPRQPQDHRLANTWRKRGAADGLIDWRMPARGIANLVRALARPYVGAHLVYRGSEVKVWRVEVVSEPAENLEPGKVIGCEEGIPLIKCGDHAVRLLHTEPSLRVAVGEYL
jgi:methionyl-tRNA formyltransferase